MLKFNKGSSQLNSGELVGSRFLTKHTGSKGYLPKKKVDKKTYVFQGMVIEEDNTGWNKLVENIEPVVRNGFIAIDIGLFETTPEKIVKRGVKNELGIGVPQRSYIALTFDLKRKQMEMMLMQSIKNHFMTTRRTTDALDSVGKFLQKEIKQFMYSNYWLMRKPNRPSTIRKKGFNQPLIETGELANSIGRRKTTGKQNKK